MGQWSSAAPWTAQRKRCFRRKRSYWPIFPSAVLIADVNPNRRRGRAAKMTPILAKDRWGRALWRMARLYRARSLYPRRFYLVRAPAQAEAKWHWMRAPRPTPPVSHGYRITMAIERNRNTMWPFYIQRKPYELKPYTTRRTSTWELAQRIRRDRTS